MNLTSRSDQLIDKHSQGKLAFTKSHQIDQVIQDILEETCQRFVPGGGQVGA